MVTQAQILAPGTAQGTALRLSAPISFWGGVDPRTAQIVQANHPERGQIITGTIFVIPELVGSSSGSAILLELIHAGRAPAALILGHADAILPIGAVIAEQMGWPRPPVLALPNPPFKAGDQLTISPDGTIGKPDTSHFSIS